MTNVSTDDLTLQFVTETVWELSRRVRLGIANSLDIDALLALEIGARTPLLRLKAQEAIDVALLNGWFDYIVNSENAEYEQCELSF